jgi:hypothetical protein
VLPVAAAVLLVVLGGLNVAIERRERSSGAASAANSGLGPVPVADDREPVLAGASVPGATAASDALSEGAGRS